MPPRRRSRSSRSLLWLWLGEGLDDPFCSRDLRLDFYWKNILLFIYYIYPVAKNAHKDFMLNFPERETEVQGVAKNGGAILFRHDKTSQLWKYESTTLYDFIIQWIPHIRSARYSLHVGWCYPTLFGRWLSWLMFTEILGHAQQLRLWVRRTRGRTDLHFSTPMYFVIVSICYMFQPFATI